MPTTTIALKRARSENLIGQSSLASAKASVTTIVGSTIASKIASVAHDLEVCRANRSLRLQHASERGNGLAAQDAAHGNAKISSWHVAHALSARSATQAKHQIGSWHVSRSIKLTPERSPSSTCQEIARSKGGPGIIHRCKNMYSKANSS
jgi:hypothetical protein